MSSKLKTGMRSVSFYLIARYPFANALTLLMLLAERATREHFPPVAPNTLYGHLAVFIICAVCMGFNLGRKEAALVHVGHLMYLAVSTYTNKNLKYTELTRMKMSLRMVGVAGFFLLYAFFTMPKPRSYQLRRLGETIIGVFLFCTLYLLLQNKSERLAFLAHVPGGEWTLYVYAIIILVSSLCYLPGLFVNDVSQLLVWIMISSTLLIDCDIHYWTEKRGMDFWNQIRLISDHVAIVLGLFMYLSCTRKKTYGEPEEQKED